MRYPRNGVKGCLRIYSFSHNHGSVGNGRYMIKSSLKIARYCPLVIQGFSIFFRVVSSDYGKPGLYLKGNYYLRDPFLTSMILMR